MAISVSVTGYITATDSLTGTTALSKALSNIANVGFTTFQEVQAGTFGTSPTSISLPVSPTQFVYIKNTHASNTLTVSWTPASGTSAIVTTLAPGSAIILLQAAVTSGGGITALSFTASAASTTAEYILAG